MLGLFSFHCWAQFKILSISHGSLLLCDILKPNSLTRYKAHTLFWELSTQYLLCLDNFNVPAFVTDIASDS